MKNLRLIAFAIWNLVSAFALQFTTTIEFEKVQNLPEQILFVFHLPFPYALDAHRLQFY